MNILEEIFVRIEQDKSGNEFLAQAGDLLYPDESLNSMLIGAAENNSAATAFVRVVENEKTVAAASASERSILLSTASPQAYELLAGYIFEVLATSPRVIGPAHAAESFAAEWCMLSGQTPKLELESMIYAATSADIPFAVPGRYRSFTKDEKPLLTRWCREFVREAIPHEASSDEQWSAFADKHINNGTAFVWLADDEPSAMAALSRPTKNTVTVSMVYTPKHLRRKGFASALVAHLTDKMLLNKQSVVLHADLANPTSNKIYQNMGYFEVGVSKCIGFK